MTSRVRPRIIGIDFDNTIARYDHIFAPAAREMGLVPVDFAGSKAATRAAIRASGAGEAGWMRLQGQVYGRLMPQARLFDGVLAFLHGCRARGLPVLIVSHKTEHGHFDEHRVNLRTAALAWMEAVRLFDWAATGLSADRVFFEGTRADKLARIADCGCTDFIDDLEEVLTDPAFPPTVASYLLRPDPAMGKNSTHADAPYRCCGSWSEIGDAVFQC